jgi:EAL domain-containing protein (putative c-di-GMP-specific phosphodiesterase class I)
MAEQVASRMDLESDLRRAVGAGELRLYYQPEVCLKTGAIVGAEALVRWEHPRRGLLGPGEFIAVAEESDVILSIGEWVLNEACRQASAWQSAGPLGKRLTMSVNLAARQLRHPGLIDQITRALDRAGLSPHRLKLELTERAVVGDAEGESDVLGALRRLGVKLAIDDFGTGYSSLGYLRRWPLDTLKIDRSFVAEAERDPASRELVGAMARLARAVKMDVTAEGIERADQLAWLRKLGVERGQGYFFAPPAPAEEFDRLLAQHRRYPVSGAALKAGAAG